MKAKPAILLGAILLVIVGSLLLVANIRSNRALVREQKARAETMYAEQEAHRLREKGQ